MTISTNSRRKWASGAIAVALSMFALALAPSSSLASAVPYHLNYVAVGLRHHAPGTEGKVWWISHGNRLPEGWLLQTPDCWGQLTCSKPPPGGGRFLDRITQLISSAQRSVDIAGLFPPPDGGFKHAIVAGLQRAVAHGYRPTVRILIGTPPGHPGDRPDAYVAELSAAVGGVLPIQGAYMSTYREHVHGLPGLYLATSWDHSKVLDVDGRSAIVGGTNWWAPDYLDTPHPVNDVSMQVDGPAAADASRFENLLWGWTCAHRHDHLYVYFAAHAIHGCMTHASTLPATASGDVPIMVVGRLGNGIEVPGEAGRQSPPIARPPFHGNGCVRGDNIFTPNTQTNNGRAYEYRNPGEDALRALIGSARNSIFISQQDLLSCAPLVKGVRLNVEARLDERIFAALATKISQGVNVKIVISNNGAGGGYSNGYTLKDLAHQLTGMVEYQRGISYEEARHLVCRRVLLTGIHNAPDATWPGGTQFANHAKLVAVDGTAFYIGSENLYPARLQELGFIVESQPATTMLYQRYVGPLLTSSLRYSLINPGVHCGHF